MRRVPLFLLTAALLVTVLPAVAVAATPVPGGPYSSNQECRQCHEIGNDGPGVTHTTDFSVGPVDKSACLKCHWVGGPATPHPFHNALTACSACHPGWGDRQQTYVPYVSTAYGWFYSAASPNLDAATLHSIHSNPRWIAQIDVPAGSKIMGFTAAGSRCPSCHAVASCTACHSGVDPATHFDHTKGDVPGWSGVTGNGTPNGDQTVLNTSSAPVTCFAATCHGSQVVQPATFVENGTAPVTGAWTNIVAKRLSGSSGIYATDPGASVSVTTNGAGSFRWMGYKTPDGGYANVLVDGSVVATVSCLGPYDRALPGSVLYSGQLSPGRHTVTVRNTGISDGGTKITFDAFVISGTGGDFRPPCGTCHPDRTDVHGYNAEMHTSSWDLSNCSEGGCHSSPDLMPLHQQHREDFQCADCHHSTDQSVQWAILQGSTGCSECHSTAHGLSLLSVPTGIPKYPAFVWSDPIDTSLYAGESWLPSGFDTTGKEIVSDRRTDIAASTVWDYYLSNMTTQGWKLQSVPPAPGADYFNVTFTNGPFVTVVMFYGGEAHTAAPVLPAGYRVEVLYR